MAEIRKEHPDIYGFLLSVSIWCFLMLAYQITAFLLMGKLWFIGLPLLRSIVPTLIMGVIVMGCIFLSCRKLRTGLRVVLGFLIGLVIPLLAGLSIGLLIESAGHWGAALQGWILGVVSAVPSGVAAAIAVIWVRPANAAMELGR